MLLNCGVGEDSWKSLELQGEPPVHPKENQSWIFIGNTDAETEAPIFWPPDVKNWLIWKDPDAGKDWGQEKWVTEDEMLGWHYWLNGDKFEQTPGDGEGQGSLACCSPWGHKELDTTERLNWLKEIEATLEWTFKFTVTGQKAITPPGEEEEVRIKVEQWEREEHTWALGSRSVWED